jgi:Zn-dependent M16 (insulinase) family peptidase
MVKMSMATFINAMTGWDCTYYPVASNVKRDLFNLADVYFDAVFHPLLEGETFKREGHHFAPADPQNPAGPLTINGIVYNEMKSGFSDPESVLYRLGSRGLFPDTVYGRESGGDPDHIPELTYEGLKHFHESFYHPSNAYFFFYGDIPTPEYLGFIEERLAPFRRKRILPDIARQPRWNRPRETTETYPVGLEEPTAAKTYLQLGWLVGDASDPADATDLYILSHVLLGHEAAPLRKAVIESKLGQDLVYPGCRMHGLEVTFHVDLKGSESQRSKAFEELVRRTLTGLVERPPSSDEIEAAFQQASYHYLEILPQRPLHLMDQALHSWIYGGDPLAFFEMKRHLDASRKRFLGHQGWLGHLIRRRLLDNPHRLAVILKPDPAWQERKRAAFEEKMKKERARLTDEEAHRIAREAGELEQRSGTPNPPEALAKLPQLRVADLPDRPKEIPTILEPIDLPDGQAGEIPFLRNEVFANGVNYLFLNFDLAGLPEELWSYLPHYADAVRKGGAAGMDYEQIAYRVTASTGGIDCRIAFHGHATDPARWLCRLKLVMKTTDDRIEPALSVLGDLLFSADPRDRKRLLEILTQAVAWHRTELVQSGAETAARRARRGITPIGRLSEEVGGLPQLALSEKALKGFEQEGERLMEKIEAIRDFLLARNRLAVSFTGSDAACRTVRSVLNDWIGRMRPGPLRPSSIGFTPFDTPPREGLAAPIQVAHCAQVLPAPPLCHPAEPLLTLGTNLVSREYLLPEIRFKGNAYGTWCRYQPLGQTIDLGSHADPHVARTLEVFAKIRDYVSGASWSQADVDRTIISTAKHEQQPIRPGRATELALHDHLIGFTPELRRARYERTLSATPEAIKQAFLSIWETSFPKGAICVVSNRRKLEEANLRMPGRELAIQNILGDSDGG